MKVWRYQDARGYGPYTTVGFSHCPDGPTYHKRKDLMLDLNDDHRESPEHPGPWEDYGHTPFTSAVFGFASKELALEWFAGYNARLLECGFDLIHVEVPDEHVYKGKSGRQVFFNKKYLLP